MLDFLHFTLQHIEIVNILASASSNHVIPGVAESLACFSRVILVVTETKPTKFILAISASHMHASLVFLNARLAFGTGLSVHFEPKIRVSIIVATRSVNPSCEHFTVNWLVSLFETAKTETLAALAPHINGVCKLLVNNHLTFFAWTPFRILGNIYE